MGTSLSSASDHVCLKVPAPPGTMLLRTPLADNPRKLQSEGGITLMSIGNTLSWAAMFTKSAQAGHLNWRIAKNNTGIFLHWELRFDDRWFHADDV